MTSSFISNSALCSSDDDDSVGSAGIMKGDVYCCPVCYTVARRSMLDKRKSHDDYSNPLDVLSDKGLQVSALFCFLFAALPEKNVNLSATPTVPTTFGLN